jgi:Flp pilus assembly protein TadG
MFAPMFSSWRRFVGDRKANVGMIFALSVPVLALSVGIAVDFTNASVTRNRLNAAADAAALAALTPAMMQQSDSVAQAAAVAMFQGRVQSLTTLTGVTPPPTVTITHPASNPGERVVTVSYAASVNALFGGVLSFFNALPSGSGVSIAGTSTAEAAGPPNINFYLLLDNSPSMALPASSSGIQSMIAYTPSQDNGNGCAFACHQASTNNSDTQGNLCSDGSTPTVASGGLSKQYCASKNSKGQSITQMDNYAMARQYNITLRLDSLSTAVTTLMQTAYNWRQTIQTNNPSTTPPIYQFAAYSMDTLWSVGANNGTTNNQLMSLTSDYQNAWTTASANFGVMEMWANNSTCNSSSCTGSGSLGDVATNYDLALKAINTAMPNPGNGTNVSGDAAQEILFWVTDGVEDEQSGSNRLIQQINANGATNWCNTIKARGIKIAILYTDYLPVPTNSFYQNDVAPFINNVGPALQACASPNLFYDAGFDTNLGTALANLFTTALQQTAALSN